MRIIKHGCHHCGNDLIVKSDRKLCIVEAMYVGAIKNDTEIFKLLIENNVSIDSIPSIPPNKFIKEKITCSWTPFLLAVEKGHIELVKLLVENGCNINATELCNRTAINNLVHVYKEQQHSKVLTYLISKGADLTIADSEGDTPLIRAIIFDKDELIEALIAAGGAQINTPEKSGLTPLKLMLSKLSGSSYTYGSHGRIYNLVKLLLEAGADPTARDNNNQPVYTDLIHCALRDEAKKCKALMDQYTSLWLKKRAIRISKLGDTISTGIAIDTDIVFG